MLFLSLYDLLKHPLEFLSGLIGARSLRCFDEAGGLNRFIWLSLSHVVSSSSSSAFSEGTTTDALEAKASISADMAIRFTSAERICDAVSFTFLPKKCVSVNFSSRARIPGGMDAATVALPSRFLGFVLVLGVWPIIWDFPGLFLRSFVGV
jgi:hypothetical protein